MLQCNLGLFRNFQHALKSPIEPMSQSLTDCSLPSVRSRLHYATITHCCRSATRPSILEEEEATARISAEDRRLTFSQQQQQTWHFLLSQLADLVDIVQQRRQHDR